MVFSSFKNKLVSLTAVVVNQVCYAVSSSVTKTTQDVLLAPRFKAYGFLEDIYHPRFQLAKDDGYCIMEQLGKIPIQTDYNSKVQFASVAEARAAMSADILEAYYTDLPGKYDSPQLYCNMTPYQQMLYDQRRDEENFDFVSYPNGDEEPIIASLPNQETNVNSQKKKKKSALKSLKSTLFRLSQK
ncbi:hypothetical protein V8B55DRAFT_1584357 [Mucor lusitanicus]|uniref:Uncharacterized protein n=2 Tax=Mucor circinelloides f. lusitanicus TaxID=29924 RepID=A0A168PJ27_MUCCL|nr:hypothetical protein FB192DRAFT_1446733 [Mucor lusitanicus]OAD07803.1 hypothetical protein MUCCIDRAFT_158056 [Mucor lusitanicus CBS 277.49]